jgi:hypothetical protein
VNAAVVRPDGTVRCAGRRIAPLVDALAPLRRPSRPVTTDPAPAAFTTR